MKNHDRYGQHIYGTVHKKERMRWVRRVRAGGVVCWRCGDPIHPWRGGIWAMSVRTARLAATRLRHPEHRSCNRATVTILKQKLAEAEAAPRGSREW